MPDLDLQSLSGRIVIVAPHMDDEALACGGLIARLPDKDRIHVIYATDGMRSPPPIFPGRDKVPPDLGRVRMRESVEAMRLLDVPEQNLHFLCLPEAELKRNKSRLDKALREKLQSIGPDILLVPFRYDRHPDHLAVNHVVVSLLEEGLVRAMLVEYFVYYRWRLLPKGDIRRYVKPPLLYRLDLSEVAERKRTSLDCFTSQNTLYLPWQTSPILSSTLLDEECRNPEYFLMSRDLQTGPAVFTGLVPWIRLVHRLEPFLKRQKFMASAYLARMVRKHDS